MELVEFCANFLNKFYGKKISFFIIVAFLVFVCCILYNSIENVVARIIAIFAIIFVFLCIFIDMYSINKLPKAKKNHTAVLIRIIAKNEEEYNDTKIKLTNNFKTMLEENRIEVIYIPYQLVEKNMYNDKEKIMKLLKKTNCIFLTSIEVKSEDVKEDTLYITTINMGIMHPTYYQSTEKKLQRELQELTHNTKRLTYCKKEKMILLENVSHEMSFVCQYVIARVTYFNGDLKTSKRISENLFQLIKQSGYNNAILINLLTELCYDIHMVIALYEFSKKEKDMELVESELKKCNQFIPNTYEYNLQMSVCEFMNTRDIVAVKEYLNKCKQINPKGEWKYSEAFLSAYQGESEGKILSKYFKAFKIQYNLLDLIVFIEDIISKENDRNMLRFALFLLYLKLEDYMCAKELYDEYIKNKEVHFLDESTAKRIIKRYNKSEIKDILNIYEIKSDICK